MDKITEVGHKMRSAIKAKLIELGSYVDDELPDYIMVMVANHRSKDMMTEDLQLFLDENTEVFVNWLHQVLQKLHEVTVNSMDIPKIAKQEARLKRKMVESKSSKSDKKDKTKIKKIKKEKEKDEIKPTFDASISVDTGPSITDEIPVSAKTIGERRISLNLAVVRETTTPPLQDKFDIPSVNEVDKLELADIETKIEAAQKKLASLDTEADDIDFINIKADEEFLEFEEPVKDSGKESHTPPTHARITFSPEVSPSKSIRPSVLDRLGTRESVEKVPSRRNSPVRKKIRLSELKKMEEELLGIAASNNNFKRSYSNGSRREESNKKMQKQSVHDRIGVMSHVIPISKSRKRSRSRSSTPPTSSVSSVVQIKPRKLLPKSVQPNKNLLLKAVAEAQKSVSALSVDHKDKINNCDESRSNNKKEIFTKHYKKSRMSKEIVKNIVIKVQTDVKVNDDVKEDQIMERSETPEYESMDENQEFETENNYNEQKPRFIVTLDGLDESIFQSARDQEMDTAPPIVSGNPEKLVIAESEVQETSPKCSRTLVTQKCKKPEKEVEKNVKSPENRIEAVRKIRRNPSPITFSKADLKKQEVAETKHDRVPALPLSKIYPTIPLKVKDRCKYWPGCRLGDSCEFMHPCQPCKMFPTCKFGDRCLYIHPPCKFDVACSRRGCPYTHGFAKPIKMPLIASTVVSVSQSPESNVQVVCKFYPNCSNVQCQYYHPKPCRFGKYCINKSECNFNHKEVPTKEKLRWKST